MKEWAKWFLILRIGSLWISILTNNIIHDLKIYDPILVNYNFKTCLNGVMTVASKLFLHKGIFKLINDRLPVGDIFSY